METTETTMFPRSIIFTATLLAAVAVFAPGIARADGLEAWGNAYCPHAMPAKNNPYWDARVRYLKLGLEEKASAAWRQANKYDACRQWTYNAALVVLLNHKSYKVLMEDGLTRTAALYTEEAIRKEFLDGVTKGTARYDTVSRVVELGYSEIAEKPADKALEIITRKTFCRCLSYPTDRVWRETH